MLKITSQLLKTEAESRGWTVEVLDEEASFMRYTLPNGKRIIGYAMTSRFTPYISVVIANNKGLTFTLLKDVDVPLPKTVEVFSHNDAVALLDEVGEIVIKPLDAAHGNGVTISIKTANQAKAAVRAAQQFSKRVIAQQQVYGDDWRLLFIGGKLAAACIRQPASVVGDGVHTIAELIEGENTGGARAANYELPKNFIDVSAAERYLSEKISQVPNKDEQVQVVGTANIGTGGIAIDKTSSVPSKMVEAGKRILEHIGMDTCAVDFLSDGDRFWLIEINANPSLGLHVYPAEGESQPVDKLYLDWLESKI